MAPNENMRSGRVKNAVLAFFSKRLIVPRVYLDANWGGRHVDILAIDRDGVGDLHTAMLLLEDPSAPVDMDELWRDRIDRIKALSAQYKYLVVQLARGDNSVAPDVFLDASFAPDGLGRVGLITIIEGPDGDFAAELRVKPERFRAFIAKQADEFVRTHEADWEIRPDPIFEESQV